MSVSMFETPGTFSNSLRTEAAQPPHVMAGRLSTTNLAPGGGGPSAGLESAVGCPEHPASAAITAAASRLRRFINDDSLERHFNRTDWRPLGIDRLLNAV